MDRGRFGPGLYRFFAAFAIAGAPLAAALAYMLILAWPDQSIESVRAIQDYGILGATLTWLFWLAGSFLFLVVLHWTLLLVLGRNGRIPKDHALRWLWGVILVAPTIGATLAAFRAIEQGLTPSDSYWIFVPPSIFAFLAVVSILFAIGALSDKHPPALEGMWVFGVVVVILLAVVVCVDLVRGVQLDPPPVLALLGWAFAALSALVFLVRLGQRSRYPVIQILLVWVLSLSLADCNDNHVLTTRRGASPTLAEDAFTRWLDAHPANKSIPAVVVVAEGGGARATYLTTLVLEELRRTCPRLYRQTFAVIGVSGGSVGAAYAIAAAKQAPPSNVCEPHTDVAPAKSVAVDAAGADLLRPLLRGALFFDIPMRFVPTSGLASLAWQFNQTAAEALLSISAWATDRASYLERGMEAAWRRAGGKGDGLVATNTLGAYSPEQPALVMLTTNVNSGRRVILGDITLATTIPAPSGECLDPTLRSTDTEENARPLHLTEIVPGLNPSLAAAAVASARFPILTSAARLPCKHALWRLVDGGYFENSGLTTAIDLIEAMARSAKRARRPVSVLLLRIENHRATTSVETRAGARPPNPAGWFPELGSPIRAFLGTREARADLARRNVERAAARRQICSPGDDCLPFNITEIELHSCRVAVPLGWSLSERAKSEIAAQVLAPARATARSDRTCLSTATAPVAGEGTFSQIERVRVIFSSLSTD